MPLENLDEVVDTLSQAVRPLTNFMNALEIESSGKQFGAKGRFMLVGGLRDENRFYRMREYGFCYDWGNSGKRNLQ